MNKFLFLILLFTNILTAQSIDSLLQELESDKEKSLYTLDEKLGNVTIYSQKDLRLMQYTTLNDLLKELPISNLNKNRFGTSTLSLPGSKTDVSGFFRIFINNHEVSSNYTQSISESWMKFPMEIVDYVEIYRGNSSFSLGNDNGVFFIRIYTKEALKDNASKFFTSVTDNGSSSQSFSHSDTLQNGWSYLTFFAHSTSKDSQTYKANEIKNDSIQNYLYLNVKKDSTAINAGYSDIKRDNYLGLSLDANSDDGEIVSKEYFVDFTTHFLSNNSMKLNISYDVNDFKYDEINSEGLALVPVLDLSNMGLTIPKEYHEDKKIIKSNAMLSKTTSFFGNNLLIGAHIQRKEYKTKENTTINFANTVTNVGKFNGYDKEGMYSLLIQDDYRLDDKLLFILNAKFDIFKRNGNLEDFENEQYRIGAIYNINDNFGFKTFYTDTYTTPTFYNIDFADKTTPNLDISQYKYYSFEGVYADQNSRFSMLYTNVRIKDFIYYSPVGFINVDHTIESKNLVLDYIYSLSEDNTLHLNYYATRLSEHLNNSNKGGYIKLTGEYGLYEYFTSLIYRNSYDFEDVHVDANYNFNIGFSYNLSQDVSVSLKAQNLFNDSSKSLYKEGFPGSDFALRDYSREVTLSLKWVF